MSILVELRPGIAEEKEGAIRLIFGTNTDTTRDFGRGRPLAEEARRHYLGRSGLSLDHEGDLKAVRARDAIASGAITLRVYDRDRAATQLGRAVPMMHAKAYIGESLAVIGSANFSRAGLRHNLEIVEAIRPSEDSFAARRAWAERTWECGTDWRAEALEILDGLLRLVSPEEAASRMLAEMTGFRPWRVDGNLLHTDTAPRRAPSPSRNSAPASSWCCFPKPP
jgi:phosphatidylserine/phosphatidylglycerophosphate/cardiolipin synthase-like enzyme